MKFIHYLSVTIAVAAVSLFYSCNDTLEVENTPPGQVTNVTFTPLYGGGYFTYTIPDDEDFLYTRAEYIIDTGKKISKTSSVYSDTLFIEGFGQEKEYEVKIYSVDRNSNESQPVIQRVTPLAPTTSAVLETVQVQPGFSSLVLDWTNVLRQNITIYVEVEVGDTKATKIYASNLAKDRYIIENLKGVPHTVNVHIRDTYENRTETRSFGQMTIDRWSHFKETVVVPA